MARNEFQWHLDKCYLLFVPTGGTLHHRLSKRRETDSDEMPV